MARNIDIFEMLCKMELSGLVVEQRFQVLLGFEFSFQLFADGLRDGYATGQRKEEVLLVGLGVESGSLISAHQLQPVLLDYFGAFLLDVFELVVDGDGSDDVLFDGHLELLDTEI